MSCEYCGDTGKMGSSGYWIKCPHCDNYKKDKISNEDFEKTKFFEKHLKCQH